MTLITVECTCKPGEEYLDGSKPEWYNKMSKVAQRMQHHYAHESLFWGVHYKGQHVMNVFDDDGKSLGRMTQGSKLSNSTPWHNYVTK